MVGKINMYIRPAPPPTLQQRFSVGHRLLCVYLKPLYASSKTGGGNKASTTSGHRISRKKYTHMNNPGTQAYMHADTGPEHHVTCASPHLASFPGNKAKPPSLSSVLQHRNYESGNMISTDGIFVSPYCTSY